MNFFYYFCVAYIKQWDESHCSLETFLSLYQTEGCHTSKTNRTIYEGEKLNSHILSRSLKCSWSSKEQFEISMESVLLFRNRTANVLNAEGSSVWG
jgi:hypothetical protein